MTYLQALPSQIFYDDSGILNVDGLAVPAIAREVATPFYCYSEQSIRDNFQVYRSNFPKALVCYAMKANSNLSILRMLVAMGAGLDVVSGGELHKALKAGAKRIVFSGVGKSAWELQLALKEGIYQINIESLSELLLLQELVRTGGFAPPSIAIRINPGIDSGTNSDLITTGRKKDKFGILEENVNEVLLNLDPRCVRLVGLSAHIGSNMRNLQPIECLCLYMKELYQRIQGKGFALSRIDLGGGIGIRYNGDEQLISMPDYSALVNDLAKSLDSELILEPGRSIVGNSGILVASVEHVKDSDWGRFVVVDASMSDFMRKVIYPDAVHHVLPVVSSDAQSRACVVGTICESSDVFSKGVQIPVSVKRGDLFVICSVGAYGFVMANNYNSHLLPAEVLVSGDRYKVIRSRQTYEDLWEQEFKGIECC